MPSEQAKVLQVAWVNIVVYRLALEGPPSHDNMVLCHDKALKIGTGPDEEFVEIIESLAKDVIRRIKELDMCKMERACLCGILLFNPGM